MSKAQLLLEEYKELGLCWRHDDQIRSKLTAVLLPLSIAALTLSYLEHGPPKLLSVCGGLMLMTFWYTAFCLYMRRFRIRFARIHYLEWILDFDSHLKYQAEIETSKWKFQRLYLTIFFLYGLIALSVMSPIKFLSTVEITTTKLPGSKSGFGITADPVPMEYKDDNINEKSEAIILSRDVAHIYGLTIRLIVSVETIFCILAIVIAFAFALFLRHLMLDRTSIQIYRVDGWAP